MARVSIYISDELKARMDKVGEAANWSGIVRPAILSEVASHEHRKGSKHDYRYRTPPSIEGKAFSRNC